MTNNKLYTEHPIRADVSLYIDNRARNYSEKKLYVLKNLINEVTKELHLDEVLIFIKAATHFQKGLAGYCENANSVYVRSMNDFELVLYTLCHELRHAWQFRTKQIEYVFYEYTGAYYTKWYTGEVYEQSEHAPWEKDAVQYEKSKYPLIYNLLKTEAKL